MNEPKPTRKVHRLESFGPVGTASLNYEWRYKWEFRFPYQLEESDWRQALADLCNYSPEELADVQIEILVEDFRRSLQHLVHGDPLLSKPLPK